MTHALPSAASVIRRCDGVSGLRNKMFTLRNTVRLNSNRNSMTMKS